MTARDNMAPIKSLMAIKLRKTAPKFTKIFLSVNTDIFCWQNQGLFFLKTRYGGKNEKEHKTFLGPYTRVLS